MSNTASEEIQEPRLISVNFSLPDILKYQRDHNLSDRQMADGLAKSECPRKVFWEYLEHNAANEVVEPETTVKPRRAGELDITKQFIEWEDDVPEKMKQLAELGITGRDATEIALGKVPPEYVAARIIRNQQNDKDWWPKVIKVLEIMDVWSPDVFVAQLRPLVDHEILVTYQAHYCIVKDYGGKPRVGQLRDNRWTFRSFEDFKKAECNQKIVVNTGEVDRDGNPKLKTVKAAEYWLEHNSAKRYATTTFAPGQQTSPDVLNLWRGWQCGYVKGGKPEKLFNHMYLYMCEQNEELLEWVIAWCADFVQNIHRPSRSALVLVGPMGSGKDTFFEFLASFIAPHSLVIANENMIVGDFNAHLRDQLLILANEALFSKNGKHANILKDVVTNPEMIVQPKGVDAFPVKKHFRTLVASNEVHAVRVALDDRRYCVLQCDAQKHNNDQEYFEDLRKAFYEGGERELFLGYLLDYPLHEWRQDRIPESFARKDQREQSLGFHEKAILDLLDEGRLHACGMDDANGWVFAESNRFPWKVDKHKAAALRELVGAHDCRARLNGHQMRGWWLPPLCEARMAFAHTTKTDPDWASDEAQWEFRRDDGAELVPDSAKTLKTTRDTHKSIMCLAQTRME